MRPRCKNRPNRLALAQRGRQDAAQRSAKTYAKAQRRLARSKATRLLKNLPRVVKHECGGSKQPHYLMYLTQEEIEFVLRYKAGMPSGADGPKGVKCGPPDVRGRRVYQADGPVVYIPIPANPAYDTAFNFAVAVERATGAKKGVLHLQYEDGTREDDKPAVVLNLGNQDSAGVPLNWDVDDPANYIHNMTNVTVYEGWRDEDTPMAQFDTPGTHGWFLDESYASKVNMYLDRAYGGYKGSRPLPDAYFQQAPFL